MAESLKALVQRLVTEGPTNIAPAASRHVRATLNGAYIINTLSAVHVWEHIYYPQYYVPFTAFQTDKEVQVKKIEAIKHEGFIVASIIKITVGNRSTQDAVYFEDIPQAGKVRGLVRVTFAAPDQWYEEDEPIYVHPKDPTKRIAYLPSTRAVEVQVDGHVLARSTFAIHLIEPLLPTRYYLPHTAADPRILRPSRTRSRCPYKGEAEYYDVVVGGKVYEDLVWWYRHPTAESVSVSGLLCFYNEKVDVFLDGEKLDRPRTKFS